MDATEMTFDEFLDNVSQQKMLDTPNVGKSCVQELINAFRVKKISEQKIKEWLSVKIKKPKKKDVTQAYQKAQKKSMTHAKSTS
jgi:hypothetical protein